MGLGTFIFHSGLDSFFESLLGTTPFSILHYLKGYFKEGIAIAAFSIGQDSQILCLIDEFFQSFDYLIRIAAYLPLSVLRECQKGCQHVNKKCKRILTIY